MVLNEIIINSLKEKNMESEIDNIQDTHQPSLITHHSKSPIFLFDGVCNLCNGAVDFIISHEKSPEILFASLQSNEAQDLLKSLGMDLSKMDTSYVFANNVLLQKSEGAIYLAKYLKKPWSFLSAFSIFPTKFLNFFYDFISKNRYRFFGKKESCKVPTASEKERFL
jgi:predicted DCC family thiol-disulfide oxidoreductase YuxK